MRLQQCNRRGAFHRAHRGLPDTDVVLARSSIPVAFEDEGAYIVRGNASKVFSPPVSSARVGNATYTLAAALLEVYNETTMQWEKIFALGAGPVELTGTTGGWKRRLTWLWERSSGLCSASDYTNLDYVQDGLVVNFDGSPITAPFASIITASPYGSISSTADRTPKR